MSKGTDINVHHYHHRPQQRSLGCLGVIGAVLVILAVAQLPYLLIPTAIIAGLVVVKLSHDRKDHEETASPPRPDRRD